LDKAQSETPASRNEGKENSESERKAPEKPEKTEGEKEFERRGVTED
jgi:hypothetical protein